MVDHSGEREVVGAWHLHPPGASLERTQVLWGNRDPVDQGSVGERLQGEVARAGERLGTPGEIASEHEGAAVCGGGPPQPGGPLPQRRTLTVSERATWREMNPSFTQPSLTPSQGEDLFH